MEGGYGKMENFINPPFYASEQENVLPFNQAARETGVTAGDIMSDAKELLKKAQEARTQKSNSAVPGADGVLNKDCDIKSITFPIDSSSSASLQFGFFRLSG